MADMKLKGLDDIKADQRLIDITVKKVLDYNKEDKSKMIRNIIIAASLTLILGGTGSYSLYKGKIDTGNTPNTNISMTKENKGIDIPAIKLPTDSNGVKARMVPLIVYQGKTYTYSSSPENVDSFLGNRIGKTVNSINEWNVKEKASEELASNIGEQEVYTVKGYDDSFRIMTYLEIDGKVYGDFYDCLNGITVKTGKDVFGKLNIADNIESAKSQNFDDWNNGVDKYGTVSDIDLLNKFSKELNDSIPYNYNSISEEIDSNRNSEGFKLINLQLKDGCTVTLSLFKNGYVSYGTTDIYFRVNSKVFNELWVQLQ